MSIFQRIFNLALRVTFPPTPIEMTDAERDQRTAYEWQQSILGYIEWRMGDAWRRLHRADQRFHEVRQHWLEVYRTCNAAFNSTAADLGSVADPAVVNPGGEGVEARKSQSAPSPSDKKPAQSARLATALKKAAGK